MDTSVVGDQEASMDASVAGDETVIVDTLVVGGLRRDFGLLDQDENGNQVEPDLEVGSPDARYRFWLQLVGLQFEVNAIAVQYYLFVDIQLFHKNLKLVFGDKLGDLVYLASAIEEEGIEPMYHLALDVNIFQMWMFPEDGKCAIKPPPGSWVKLNAKDFFKEVCIYSPETVQSSLIVGDSEEAFAASWDRIYQTFLEHLSDLKRSKDEQCAHLFGGIGPSDLMHMPSEDETSHSMQETQTQSGLPEIEQC